MEQKLRSQIAWLESLCASADSGNGFDADMQKIIEDRKYFQHERLIHLLVTLGIALILMLTLQLLAAQADLLYGVFFIMLAVLEFAYLIHYFRLEKGVQKLWVLEQHLLEKSIDPSAIQHADNL